MKNIFYILLIAIMCSTCSKQIEDVIDCFGESLLLDVHHHNVQTDPKQVNFNVTYSGDHNLDTTIKWNFGDGTPSQNVSGVSTSHTYSTAGSYTVKATITLNNKSCSYDVAESVTIE